MCPIRQAIASFTQCNTGALSWKQNNFVIYSYHKEDTVEIQSKNEEGREGYQKSKPLSERNLQVGWFFKLIFYWSIVAL